MRIHLRYCSSWNYEPKAVSLAAKLLVQYKRQISGLELEPSIGGCFEVTVGDELIYSKLETGIFPEEDEIVNQIGHRIHGIQWIQDIQD